MPNAADPESLVAALASRLGRPVPSDNDGRIDLHFSTGQRTTAEFANAGVVTISTPIAGAHRGLPDTILLDLLVRNAPDGDIAGGSLQVRAGQGDLEIANTLPVALGAEAIAAILINQANAATLLTEGIRRDVAALLAANQPKGDDP